MRIVAHVAARVRGALDETREEEIAMNEMNRRTLIAGLGATGLALGLTGKAFAQQAKPAAHAGGYSQVETDCIKACTDCHDECVSAVNHCIGVGGDHVKAAHLRLLQNCAQICTVAADFMLSNSDVAKELCAVCEDLCKRCADSCAQFTSDQAMQQCATVCRQCADACKKFIES